MSVVIESLVDWSQDQMVQIILSEPDDFFES